MNLQTLKTIFQSLSEKAKLNLIIELRKDRRVVKALPKKKVSKKQEKSIAELSVGVDRKELAMLINKLERELKTEE